MTDHGDDTRPRPGEAPPRPGAAVDTVQAPLDRASAVPLYHQLYLVILNQLEVGTWAVGEAISTEEELAERYDVSRTTIRQALQQLVWEGYLQRRHGRGTFVAEPKVHHGTDQPFGVTLYLRAQGMRPQWRLLGMAPMLAPRRVAEALRLHDGQVLEIRRLLLGDDEVIGFHTAYIPFPLAARLQASHLMEGNSFFHLESGLGLKLGESRRVIGAIAASETDAELLETEVDSPLLQIQRTTFSADGRPVEFLHALYRGGRSEYHLTSHAGGITADVQAAATPSQPRTAKKE
ncbi:MAG: hypothetical protein A2146_05025 [Actinobacteria bacterium RBG_16_67_10]|nr:MAG: hypothetical protein A2146_05025 [Actinobacteria bacterium RBG_16_67_10]